MADPENNATDNNGPYILDTGTSSEFKWKQLCYQCLPKRYN